MPCCAKLNADFVPSMEICIHILTHKRNSSVTTTIILQVIDESTAFSFVKTKHAEMTVVTASFIPG
jgi:hypothetical protein